MRSAPHVDEFKPRLAGAGRWVTARRLIMHTAQAARPRICDAGGLRFPDLKL